MFILFYIQLAQFQLIKFTNVLQDRMTRQHMTMVVTRTRSSQYMCGHEMSGTSNTHQQLG